MTFHHHIYTCLSLNKFVEDIVNEYSLDIPVLEIVIDKLNRNHSEEELYLEKLQNTILQHILEQEVDTSSVSFTEQEIKVIDIMEILTAHIDFSNDYPRSILNLTNYYFKS